MDYSSYYSRWDWSEKKVKFCSTLLVKCHTCPCMCSCCSLCKTLQGSRFTNWRVDDFLLCAYQCRCLILLFEYLYYVHRLTYIIACSLQHLFEILLAIACCCIRDKLNGGRELLTHKLIWGLWFHIYWPNVYTCKIKMKIES